MPSSLPEEKHIHEPLNFPDGFLWGAATSAYQVEGGNIWSDWWVWDQTLPEDERAGLADDHYHRFEEDFAMAKELGHNSHRLSIEWSRIEPEEGQFNEEAIQHYVEVLKSLKAKNFTVMLTLWHFSNPNWLTLKGGWLNGKSAWYFERFVKKVLPEIKEYVDIWLTLNEPSGYSYDAYGRGKFPPQKKGFFNILRANWNFAQAHKRVYKLIHKNVAKAQVGIAHNVASFTAYHKHSMRENAAVWFYDLFYNHTIYKMTGMKTHDFLGLNYYFNNYISFNGEKAHLPSFVDVATTKKDVSDLGWEIYPEGLFEVLMDMSDYHKPVYITENGLASTNDDRRTRFLLSYLKEIYHAIASGVKVEGYFHWSLMDNYEWVEGFKPRFGIVAIDYDDDLKRIPRPSSSVYREIIKNNGIPHYLLKLLGHSTHVEEVLAHPHK